MREIPRLTMEPLHPKQPVPSHPTPGRRKLGVIATDTRNKNPGGKLRDRRGEVLFVDARKVGSLVDRTRKEFADEEISKIAGTYHAWREGKRYVDVSGFCKAAKVHDIRTGAYSLTPGRFVGAEDVEEDEESCEAKMKRLATLLRAKQLEARELDAAIATSLEELGYGR